MGNKIRVCLLKLKKYYLLKNSKIFHCQSTTGLQHPSLQKHHGLFVLPIYGVIFSVGLKRGC